MIPDIVGASTGVATVAIDVSKADAGTKYLVADGGAGVITVTNQTTNVAQTLTATNMGILGNEVQVGLNFGALGLKFTIDQTIVGAITGTDIAGDLDAGPDVVSDAGSGAATFRVGSEITDNVSVSFNDLRSSALGGSGTELNTLVADNTGVSTVALADALLGALDTAIGQVSTQRAKLGAAQNQMESAIASVAVSIENLSASESRIRDADIAMVSSELVTRQIMQQAGVSVLAQANSAPQSVLNLLG